jgi:hypothetical protein
MVPDDETARAMMANFGVMMWHWMPSRGPSGAFG